MRSISRLGSSADGPRLYFRKSARDFPSRPTSPAKDFLQVCPSPCPPFSRRRRRDFRLSKCLARSHRGPARNLPASINAAQRGWNWQRMLLKQLQAQRGYRPKIEQDSYTEWRCPGGAPPYPIAGINFGKDTPQSGDNQL